ncbi:MAG TPA: MarR family transcriptional regulator [Acidimicrobiales bacterium]|nr:MarR family transcriptional regulator [Acidimicrobiales bacterium]
MDEHPTPLPPAPPRPGRTGDTTLELAELLSHSARRLRRGSTAQLAPLGITGAQAGVLHIVASAGRPLRMAEIATRLEVVPRSVTTLVDGVEASGLIVRSADPDDRRSVLVSLTARGRALLQSLEGARRATADEVFGALTGDERADLARLLGALCRYDGCCRCAGPSHDTQGATPHRRGAGHPRTHEGGT